MLIHLLLIFTLLFQPGLPQTSSKSSKPDFTGIWNARILASPKASVIGLKISYNDPKLEISRILTTRTPTIFMGQLLPTRSSLNFVYYTDGRGETQKSVAPNISSDSIKSKTERLGEKFVTTSSHTSKQSGRNITSHRAVTFEVSSDGKSLTETITSVTEGNTQRIAYLYDRIGVAKRDINGEWIQRIGESIISLIVEHHDPELRVTRRLISEGQYEAEVSDYYTDGRGEINVTNGQLLKSVTKWKGQKLLFSVSSTSKLAGDTIKFRQSWNWEIKKDGQSLVEVTQSRMSASLGFFIEQPDAMTLVYVRSAKPLP